MLGNGLLIIIVGNYSAESLSIIISVHCVLQCE